MSNSQHEDCQTFHASFLFDTVSININFCPILFHTYIGPVLSCSRYFLSSHCVRITPYNGFNSINPLRLENKTMPPIQRDTFSPILEKTTPEEKNGSDIGLIKSSISGENVKARNCVAVQLLRVIPAEQDCPRSCGIWLWRLNGKPRPGSVEFLQRHANTHPSHHLRFSQITFSINKARSPIQYAAELSGEEL